MFNKKIIVSNHAIKRYNERSRSQGYRGRTTYKSILADLRPMNVLRIEKLEEENTMKVYTRGKREFIVEEKNNHYIVRTILQKNREGFAPSKMRKV